MRLILLMFVLLLGGFSSTSLEEKEQATTQSKTGENAAYHFEKLKMVGKLLLTLLPINCQHMKVSKVFLF